MQSALNVAITPHREFMPSDAPEQKLFVMLKLRPTKDAASSRPATCFTFVIDTSGSMCEEVGFGKRKIEVAIESLATLIHSNGLSQSDRLAIVKFDETASTLVGLTPATQTSIIENAIHQLGELGGSTMMGLGMRQALNLLANQDMASRRALILTDGHTFDEDRCIDIAQEFSRNGIPITVLGIGDNYNEDLLINFKDITGGECFHVVAGAAKDIQVSIMDLPKILFAQFSQGQQEVITDLALNVKTVQGVTLTRIVRVYPDQAEFPMIQEPYQIGNAMANDETIFILEFNVASRPPSRARIAQIGLTYKVPGQNRRGELPPQNLVVQFMAGQVAVQVDQKVMGYVQQSNIYQLVNQATQLADSNPQKAEELLETAKRMTVRLGNEAMTSSLNEAQNELRKTRQISSSTRKTVKMGAKGKTVKMGDDLNDQGLSEEQIRQISGT